MPKDKEAPLKESDQAIPLSESEKLMMSVLTDLGADAYASTIRQEIEKRTGRSVSLGTIYLILDKLEVKGYVNSLWKPATSTAGEQAKRHFTIHKTQD
jgi:PadR family transcriptional regulator PadR